MVMDFHIDSPLGTKFIMRPFAKATGSYSGHDYLLSQIYGGSYKSTVNDPLFAVQVAMCPYDSATMPPGITTFDYAQLLLQAVGKHPTIWKPKSKITVNIDTKEHSPNVDNNVTQHTSQWGLDISAELGTDSAGTGVNFGYNQSTSRTVHDLEVYSQLYQTARDPGAGVIWDLIFTKKDGMNTSSLTPRLDALFSCNKGSFDSGRLNFMLTEKLIYWGDWAEHVDLTIGDGAGIGAGVGAVLGLGILSVPFAAVGSAIGAAIGASAGNPHKKADHNKTLADANKGDPKALVSLFQNAYAEKKVRSNSMLLSLDFDKKKVETLAKIEI